MELQRESMLVEVSERLLAVNVEIALSLRVIDSYIDARCG